MKSSSSASVGCLTAIARMGNGEFQSTPLVKGFPLNPLPTPASTLAAIALLRGKLCLTPRQSEVLYWIAEGKTNEEIGIILGCSFFTVKAHAKAIFRILQVDSRTAAAGVAHRTFAVAAKESIL
jgi:DNA-binding CsgD family transcriptional regulator